MTVTALPTSALVNTRPSARVQRRASRAVHPSSRPAAFTLLEVLATIVLIAIILPVAMHGVSLALWAADNARHQAEATTLAQSKLAELTASSFMAGGNLGGDFGEDWPAYRWESSTVSRDYGLYEIDVAVLWTSRGVERSVVLSTLTYKAVTQ